MRAQCECGLKTDPQRTPLVPNPKPNKPDICVQCSGHIDHDADWASNTENLSQFFNRLTDCQNLPITFPYFQGEIETREKFGRAQFGFEYLRRNNLTEAREEACDLALYAHLDILKARREGIREEDGIGLALTMAYYAAKAYDAALRLQAKRNGAP